MKLLLLICLVGSAFAIPISKTKREILPGDTRYDPLLHGNPGDRKHQKTDIEITEALGGYTGTFATPDIAPQFQQFRTESRSGSTEFLDQNADFSNSALTDSSLLKFSDSKFSEQLISDVETNIALPKDEPMSNLFPSTVRTTSDQPDDTPAEEKPLEGDKTSTETTEETKFETDSATDGTPSDAAKTTMKPPTNIPDTISARSRPDDIGTVVKDCFGTSAGVIDPSLGSPLSSQFDNFQLSGYQPSFDSGPVYTPNFNGFNTEYNLNNNYDLPSFGAVSLDQVLPSQSYDFQGSFYSPPQIVGSTLYPSFSNFDMLSSYFPSVGQAENVGPQKDQSKIIKKDEKPISVAANPVPPKQETSASKSFDSDTSKELEAIFKQFQSPIFTEPNFASFQSSTQPKIGIDGAPFLGNSRLIARNSGYVY